MTVSGLIQEHGRLVPDGVIEISCRHKPWCCTVALGSTQPPTEMKNRDIF